VLLAATILPPLQGLREDLLRRISDLAANRADTYPSAIAEMRLKK
jgi:hypothetical protein